jgi:hypothetical protein
VAARSMPALLARNGLTLDYHDPKKLAVHNGISCTVAGYREQHSGADQKQPP